MSWIDGLIKILTFAVGFFKKIIKRKEEAEHQESYDSIESDPAGEFDRRFNRVQLDESQNQQSETTEANVE